MWHRLRTSFAYFIDSLSAYTATKKKGKHTNTLAHNHRHSLSKRQHIFLPFALHSIRTNAGVNLPFFYQMFGTVSEQFSNGAYLCVCYLIRAHFQWHNHQTNTLEIYMSEYVYARCVLIEHWNNAMP